jgi:hypothetical protein
MFPWFEAWFPRWMRLWARGNAWPNEFRDPYGRLNSIAEVSISTTNRHRWKSVTLDTWGIEECPEILLQPDRARRLFDEWRLGQRMT